MARNWKQFDNVGRIVGIAAIVASCGLSACGSTSAGGGGGTTGAAAGTPCNPTSQNQGCFNGVRMQCTADSSSTLGGKWSLSGPCATGQTCVEAADPADANKHIAQCKGASGTDATTSADGAIIGGDDATTGGKDTSGTIGSCGDGFCNTGETATSCPADCGAANNCGNGVCDAGETKASCPADCSTTTNKCGNGICDAGETKTSCPADCSTTTNNCGNGVCDAGETSTSCPGDCPTGGTDPTACLQANCANEYNACGTDQACVDLLTCLGNCTGASDTACINACAQTAGQAAVTEYTNLGNCGTTNNCFAGGGTTGTCGDGTCDANETKTSCPADCGSGGTAGNICDANCGGTAPLGAAQCYCDNQCGQIGDCCDATGANKAKTCAGSTCADCGGGGGTTVTCNNNGMCDPGETTANCPADCKATGGTCTTYSDVQAILKNNCNGCHSHQFGTSCAANVGHDVAGWVASGQMPTNKKLSAADKAKIAAWAAAGNPCTTAQCP